MPAITMSDMRKLNEQHKIPGRSLPEIASRYDAAVSRQQNAVGRKFNDRKVSAEAVTNAVVLHFLSLDPAEQDSILDRFVPELEDLLGLKAGRPVETVPSVKHTADISEVERLPKRKRG